MRIAGELSTCTWQAALPSTTLRNCHGIMCMPPPCHRVSRECKLARVTHLAHEEGAAVREIRIELAPRIGRHGFIEMFLLSRAVRKRGGLHVGCDTVGKRLLEVKFPRPSAKLIQCNERAAAVEHLE
jgi:hypothetical protein